MAGFKQAIVDLEPKLFLTFDGDDFNPVTYDLLGSPRQIFDESGFENHAIFHADNGVYLGHRMGVQSLVDLEQATQYAMSFGFYGAQPLYTPTVWAKTFLEVPNTSSFAFPNKGSFTISTMFYKAADEAAFRSYQGYSGSLTRPIISKSGVVKIELIDVASGSDQLRVEHPGGVMTHAVTHSQFYGDQKHLVFVWDVVDDPTTKYKGTASLYINGLLVQSQTYTYADDYPITNVNTPWYICGNTSAPSSTFNDRTTSDTRLDQIAVLDTALTHDQVCDLFKKTRSYERMIDAVYPSNYWVMDDFESVSDTTISARLGSYDGEYLGGSAKVVRRRPGPPGIPGSLSVLFNNGGCGVIHRKSSNYVPLFNPTTDYSIEFWFTFSSVDRGVLFSIQGDNSPFNGMVVQANMRNNLPQAGAVQFNVTEDSYVSSIAGQRFDNGYFHHCAVIRRAGVIELWLDGTLQESKAVAPVQIQGDGPGQVYLMSMMPGKLSVMGNMCHVALISRALQPAEIRMRHRYAIIYRIQGTVTLQGVPHRADVRAYRHIDGELLQIVQSDPNDGNYILHMVDNSLVDLMILNKADINVRYRAYGPILPSAYEDLP